MSELEQVKKVLAQAESVLEESKENLTKSQTFNEVMVEQNRRLSFALSNLLPKSFLLTPNETEGASATQLAQTMESASFEVLAEELADNFKQREIFDIVHAINVLAMANTDVIHVFTEFAPHINQFGVNVYGVSQDYISNPCIKPLIQELVFLADNEALEKLLSIESQLTELIIEAREEAEAKAEVEA
ncbi:hypothetical protein L4C38_07040 [Vibrio kasasachensis]|uniref:hypothetical protein n=1 Tax=Vibrio kasasachensis TaxID=2910248 RepID=UPI003D0B5689